MRCYPALLWAVFLAGCASPEVIGQQVGQSLYHASVNTGHALALVGDRTGSALQNAGTNLRQAVNPPPSSVAPEPLVLPPPYVPDDMPPVTSQPPAPAY